MIDDSARLHADALLPYGMLETVIRGNQGVFFLGDGIVSAAAPFILVSGVSARLVAGPFLPGLQACDKIPCKVVIVHADGRVRAFNLDTDHQRFEHLLTYLSNCLKDAESETDVPDCEEQPQLGDLRLADRWLSPVQAHKYETLYVEIFQAEKKLARQASWSLQLLVREELQVAINLALSWAGGVISLDLLTVGVLRPRLRANISFRLLRYAEENWPSEARVRCIQALRTLPLGLLDWISSVLTDDTSPAKKLFDAILEGKSTRCVLEYEWPIRKHVWRTLVRMTETEPVAAQLELRNLLVTAEAFKFGALLLGQKGFEAPVSGEENVAFKRLVVESLYLQQRRGLALPPAVELKAAVLAWSVAGSKRRCADTELEAIRFALETIHEAAQGIPVDGTSPLSVTEIFSLTFGHYFDESGSLRFSRRQSIYKQCHEDFIEKALVSLTQKNPELLQSRLRECGHLANMMPQKWKRYLTHLGTLKELLLHGALVDSCLQLHRNAIRYVMGRRLVFTITDEGGEVVGTLAINPIKRCPDSESNKLEGRLLIEQQDIHFDFDELWRDLCVHVFWPREAKKET